MNTPLIRQIGLLSVIALVLCAPARTGHAEQTSLAFSKGASNEFTFDTGVLRGKLRAGGKSTGLSSVVDVASGVRLDRSWDRPSEAALLPDGSVRVVWPPAAEYPFELQAVYRWAAPNVLDLETRVTAKTSLPKFESFLASYFAEDFTNSSVYVSHTPGGGTKGFMAAERSAGIWQAFPRAESDIPVIRDGRWKLPPNPVDWVIMPRLEKPLSLRRSPVTGLTAVFLSPPEDCFAISTPQQAEPHNSMYLSLFGRALQPGETARARARLVIGSKLSDAEMVRLYDESFPR